MEALLQGQRVELEHSRYFSSKRDTAIINSGGFLCQACLVGKSQTDISSDKRYCQGCYDFLVDEAEMLPTKKRPAWIPKHNAIQSQKVAPKSIPHPPLQVLNMSTLNDETPKVDKIIPRGRPGSYKKFPLPNDIIRQLNRDGIGSKAIATHLKGELGIDVSYKTIQRVLSGERK